MRVKLKLPRLSKSVKLGASRITVSRRGVSSSVGNKWFRIGLYPEKRGWSARAGQVQLTGTGDGLGRSLLRIGVAIVVALLVLVIATIVVVRKGNQELERAISGSRP